MDVIQGRPGAYPAKVARRNLRQFLEVVTTSSQARIVFVIIPTKFALLEPGWHETESIHMALCQEFGIPVLNLYNIVRESLGIYCAERVQKISALAPVLADAFGLPRQLGYDLGWGLLRNPMAPSNAMGFYAFTDSAHINRAMHELIYELISRWIFNLGNRNLTMGRTSFQNYLRHALLDNSPSAKVRRSSSLISRDLRCFEDGDTAILDCPPGFLIVGMLINQAKTCGYINLASRIGSVTLDCRLTGYPIDWTGIVIPIFDSIGDGPVTITISKLQPVGGCLRHIPGTAENSLGRAEIGEFIIVKESHYHAAKGLMPDYISRHGGFIQIESLDWAQDTCTAFQRRADKLLGRREQADIHVFPESAAYIRGQLAAGNVDPGVTGRARWLLLFWEIAALQKLLVETLENNGNETEIARMSAALAAFLAAGQT